MDHDRHAWLAGRAYHIWLYEGCPDGRALAHWLQAEEELCEAERAAQLVPPPTPKWLRSAKQSAAAAQA